MCPLSQEERRDDVLSEERAILRSKKGRHVLFEQDRQEITCCAALGCRGGTPGGGRAPSAATPRGE